MDQIITREIKRKAIALCEGKKKLSFSLLQRELRLSYLPTLLCLEWLIENNVVKNNDLEKLEVLPRDGWASGVKEGLLTAC